MFCFVKSDDFLEEEKKMDNFSATNFVVVGNDTRPEAVLWEVVKPSSGGSDPVGVKEAGAHPSARIQYVDLSFLNKPSQAQLAHAVKELSDRVTKLRGELQ